MSSSFQYAFAILVSIAVILAACSSSEEAPQAPSKNATVKAMLLDERVTSGSPVHYNVTITNLGKEQGFDVAIEHRIFSTPLARIVKTEGEIVKLDNWVYRDKALDLPSDAPSGNYQLIVVITYGVNGSAESGGFFEVVPKIEEVTKENKAPSSGTANSSGKESPNTVKESPGTGKESQGRGGAPSFPIDQPNPKPASTSPATGSATKGVDVNPPVPEALPKEAPKEVTIVTIEHKERTFIPNKITIEPGTTIVWINRDKTSAVVDGSGFHSEPLGSNNEFRHTFSKPGIFDYYSHLTKAGGTITVEDPDHPLQFKRNPMSFKGGLNS